MSDHYFSTTPQSADERREITATIWGAEFSFTTSSGVFARDGLDKGTAVLFKQVPPPTDAPLTILDLGCGYGPIAIALAKFCPNATVWAVDVNPRALELTRLNAAANQVTVQVAAPEDVPVDLQFDQLWSNPPLHSGKQALHELLLAWLPRVKQANYLVVGRNLGSDPLQTWLTEHGYPADRLGSAKGFRVLLARPDS